MGLSVCPYSSYVSMDWVFTLMSKSSANGNYSKKINDRTKGKKGSGPKVNLNQTPFLGCLTFLPKYINPILKNSNKGGKGLKAHKPLLSTITSCFYIVCQKLNKD